MVESSPASFSIALNASVSLFFLLYATIRAPSLSVQQVLMVAAIIFAAGSVIGTIVFGVLWTVKPELQEQRGEYFVRYWPTIRREALRGHGAEPGASRAVVLRAGLISAAVGAVVLGAGLLRTGTEGVIGLLVLAVAVALLGWRPRVVRIAHRDQQRSPGTATSASVPEQRWRTGNTELTRGEACRLLGLPETADVTTARDAYRELIEVVDPDRGGDPVMFEMVQDAWAVIRDSG